MRIGLDRQMYPTPLTSEEAPTYRSTVGSLSYLVIKTKSDIASKASRLGAKIAGSTVSDINDAKSGLRYLQSTKELTFKLRSGKEGQLSARLDDDWTEEKIVDDEAGQVDWYDVATH